MLEQLATGYQGQTTSGSQEHICNERIKKVEVCNNVAFE